MKNPWIFALLLASASPSLAQDTAEPQPVSQTPTVVAPDAPSPPVVQDPESSQTVPPTTVDFSAQQTPQADSTPSLPADTAQPAVQAVPPSTAVADSAPAAQPVSEPAPSSSSSEERALSSSSSIPPLPPASTSQPGAQAEKTSEPKNKEGVGESAGSGESVGFGISGSIAVGTMTYQGEQVTRISYRPEITIGSLGVALDLELFLGSDGRIMPLGWLFDTRDETINSLYRKIYYIRWNQPGDKFYARVGALEGITMDAAGLITSDWGNVANYPGQKLVGVHVQFNDWLEPWGVSLEVANNSLEDWAHKGGVVATKVGFKPLGSTGLPILSGFKLGAVGVADFNQFATVADRDGDNCPDEVDDADGDPSTCRYLSRYVDADEFERRFADSADQANGHSQLLDYLQAQDLQRDGDETRLRDRFRAADKFQMWGIDYHMPIITTDLLSLAVYGEYAQPYVSPDPYNLNDSWGLVPVGAALQVSIVTAGLEYRELEGRFQPGNFNASYEMERARYMNFGGITDYYTKEQVYWESAADQGRRRGIYGRLGLDLFQFLNVGGSYSHLFADKGRDDRSFTTSASLGKTVVQFIPKLHSAEVYYNKNRIGEDGDGFFARSIYSEHGYRIGFDMGGGMAIVVDNRTTYVHGDNGELEPVSNFAAETVFTF